MKKMLIKTIFVINILIFSCKEKKLVDKHGIQNSKYKFIKKDAEGKGKKKSSKNKKKIKDTKNNKNELNDNKFQYQKNKTGKKLTKIKEISNLNKKKNKSLHATQIYCGNHSKILVPEVKLGDDSKKIKNNCRELLFFVPKHNYIRKNKTSKDLMKIAEEVRIKLDFHHVMEKTKNHKKSLIRPKLQITDIQLRDENNKLIWLKGINKDKEIKDRLFIKSSLSVPIIKNNSVIDVTHPVKFKSIPKNTECKIIENEYEDGDIITFSAYTRPSNIRLYRSKLKNHDIDDELKLTSFSDLMDNREKRKIRFLNRFRANDEDIYAHKFVKRYFTNSKIIIGIKINGQKKILISKIKSVDDDYNMNCEPFRLFR